MKKLLMTLGFVFAAGLLFTSESPSLDGRAIVADAGVFPRGLFAKTVGYLPGDSIGVTNPANGERVDILVIGSLDPSEGVAVLLSPEAAEALGIKKNTNNLVKLTKRSGTTDEICNGSAVLANAPAADDEGANEAEKTVEEIVKEAEENGVPVEEAVAEAVAEAEEKIAEEEEAKEEAEAEVAKEEAEGAEVAEAEEGEAGYPAYEEPVVDELSEAQDEEPAEFVEANVTDEPAAQEPEVAVVEEPAQEEPVNEEPINEEPLDEYDAIVLVPSDAKTPESADTPAEEAASEPEPANEELPVQRSAGVSYFDSYGELDAQKYYVQIASCDKSENASQIAAQYSERYPMAIVQNGSRAPVLVGPLSVDEYGVVLERFKAYGFKDAFVKYNR